MEKQDEDLTLPDWLPDGWIMEVRKGKKGFTYRYYTCPITDYTFCSKEDVICYLNNVNVSRSSASRNCSRETAQSLLKVKDALQWLPPGWITDIRTRETDEGEEKKYMCYLNQDTGYTFDSKEDVHQFLKMRNTDDCPVSTRKRFRSIKSNDKFVLSRIEHSPSGLPDGWIKEIKFRRNKTCASNTRQDPYYIDTGSGYIFRTLKDCFLYIEDGIVSKYAYKPRKYSICDILELGVDSSDSPSPGKSRMEDICDKAPLCKPTSQVKTEEPGEETVLV